MIALETAVLAVLAVTNTEPYSCDPRSSTELYCVGYAAAMDRVRGVLREWGVAI